MGGIKHKNKILKLFDKSPVLDYKSIERVIRYNGMPDSNYAKQSIRNLIREGKISKVVRGWYSKFENPELTVFCYKPAYLGLQDAISYHNLWEQETIPVIITTKKIRQGIRVVNGTNVYIRRINAKYMFGYELISNGKYHIPVSNIEKTLIDMIYFRQKMSEETHKEFNKKIDKKKLKKYLKKYPTKLNKKIENEIDKILKTPKKTGELNK